MADKIMLIRHAEKPDAPPPKFGVDEAGQQNPDELVVCRWQRAGALTCLFSPRTAQSRNPALVTASGLRHGCCPSQPQLLASAHRRTSRSPARDR